MKPVYFDLSELFIASSSNMPYYGIVRTVIEVAFELSLLDRGVRFAIYSPAHQQFFAVDPTFTACNGDIICDLGLPEKMKPIHLRGSFAAPAFWRDLLYPIARQIVSQVNRRRWKVNKAAPLKRIDLTGQTLVAFTRPKIMVNYLTAMARQKVEFNFCPLLHDMIPLHEFEGSNASKFARNFRHDNAIAIKHASLLLSNSEFTKHEIEHFSKAGALPATLPDIATVPLAHEFREVDDTPKDGTPSEHYFLCVGIQTGRKNVEIVLEAMLLLSQSGRPVPRLVLAGMKRERLIAYLEQPEFTPIRDRVEFRINPDQVELGALYENARGLVMSSRMEGWGLPLGEAMWLGTPGISSTAPALKEVGGDAVTYFDPDAPDQLADILHLFNTDDAAFNAAGTDKSNLRRWADVAHDVLEAVRDAQHQSSDAV